MQMTARELDELRHFEYNPRVVAALEFMFVFQEDYDYLVEQEVLTPEIEDAYQAWQNARLRG